MNNYYPKAEIEYVPIDEELELLKNFIRLAVSVPEDQMQVTTPEK